MGYMTGQFGKNHLGDLDEHLPSNHGFDEFFGNLYRLNAEEEPENPDYPKDPEFKKKFGPRGVIHSFADGKIEDTGPLTKKRMETIDEESLAAGLDFLDRAHKAEKPFFMWFNTTRMHVWTHLKESSKGVTGQGIYADGMVEHDGHVGQLLDKLDELGITDNTIVMYSTDNGAELMTWPDGGMIPFRGEKNTTWEGGFRVPMMVKWPGKIKPEQISNEIISMEDWLPTLVAAAGDANIKEKLLKGHRAGDMTYKVHLDGYNMLPYFTGQVKEGPRKEMFYFTDDGQMSALRYGDWKIMFSEQRAHGLEVWQDPLVTLRAPKIFNLRRDPFERAVDVGDRVGAVVFNDSQLIDIRPQRSQKTVMSILGAVVRMNHELRADTQVEPNAAMLNRALEKALRLAPHDVLVVMIGDFFGVDEETERLTARMAEHNDVLALLVHDPIRLNPARLRMSVSDGSQQIEMNLTDKRMREKLAANYREEQDHITRFLRKLSAPLLMVSNEGDVVEQVRGLLGVPGRAK